MSKHIAHLSESDLSFSKSLLKLMVQDLQSFQLRQLQHEKQIIEEKKKRDYHLEILEEEFRIIKERRYYIVKIKKTQPSSFRTSDSHSEEGSHSFHDYYQPTPRRTRRESPTIETRVDLPHFYGKENVEAYLDWEIKEKTTICLSPCY